MLRFLASCDARWPASLQAPSVGRERMALAPRAPCAGATWRSRRLGKLLEHGLDFGQEVSRVVLDFLDLMRLRLEAGKEQAFALLLDLRAVRDEADPFLAAARQLSKHLRAMLGRGDSSQFPSYELLDARYLALHQPVVQFAVGRGGEKFYRRMVIEPRQPDIAP